MKQSNKVTNHKVTYKISGMDCDSCAKMIELDMEDAGFVAKCSYTKQTLEIEVSNTSVEKKIKEIVTKSGYNIS
jgi:cation transport ATPase